jgi:hypothetical protein
MSATYSIFSPLAPREMLELEQECTRAVEQYLEDHPDCDDEWGEMQAGGSIPRAEEVRTEYARLGLVLDADVLERLSRCGSVFSIDRPGDIETMGGLQVSILRYVLQRTGEGLVLLNDYPFEPSEALLSKLRARRGASGFGVTSAPKRRRALRREAKPGELRALRVLQVLERAVGDVRVAIDVKQGLRSVGELARNYAALLLEEGAQPDLRAAKALGVSRSELESAADELERALIR